MDSKKLELRPYSELSFIEKFQKLSIPIRNNIVYRAVMSLPARIWRELLYMTGQRILIQYKKLNPDFSLNDRYPHISDDDAFISMDAHAGLMYFLAEGWHSPSHQGLVRRMMMRGEEILITKPKH